MGEPEIHVENRETLAYLLAEAAEIEHGLMCCYLYAAFSLGDKSGATPEQGAAMDRWVGTIVQVAKDEMIHLALVANLMNAIGAAPHLGRQNFPVAAGYHPAGVVVSLAPFSRGTIDHFVFLERPEGVDLPDGAGFPTPRSYVRALRRGRLVPSAQDYGTVGHLYRGIEFGFRGLAQRLGESELFCGDARLQVDSALIGLPAITPVTDLESAVAAIETIVAQGEGTKDAPEHSHYRRFVGVQTELAALQAADPHFEPAAHVARSPVMRRPPVPEGLLWVDAEPAASVLDVANALYGFALRALGVVFAPSSLVPGARALAADAMATAMMSLSPVARLLTTLPASTTRAGVNAGMTFTMNRTIEPPPDTRSGFRALAESAAGIVVGLRQHAVPLNTALQAIADGIDDLAKRLRQISENAPPGGASAPSVA